MGKNVLMRYVVFIVAGCILSVGSLFAFGEQCRHGMSWAISHNPAWGYGKPVVTRVLPYSPAERARIRVGDIIDMIDGYRTDSLNALQINQIMQTPDKLHTLETSGFGRVGRKHIIAYECRDKDALTERELAELFSLYSVEDANQERIVYPYSYSPQTHTSLLNFRTFRFAPSSPSTAQIDKVINSEIAHRLRTKGLEESQEADLIISTHYQLVPVEGSASSGKANEGFSWRFDIQTNSLSPFPLYNFSPSGISQAKYTLNFGIVMQSSKTNEVLWACEANEYLSDAITLENYARSSVYTMLLGFPYTPEQNAPRFVVRTLRYNYTGLIYSQSQMNLIHDIEVGSPAMKAGLRVGDIVRSINGQRLDKSSDVVLNNYFTSTERLERYRDKSLPPLTAYTGHLPLSYWRVDAYPNVLSALSSESKLPTPFAYLFAFRPYISPIGNRAIIFEIERNGSVYHVPVEPSYRDETCTYIDK